jgi:hypothetical protein
MSTTTCYLCAKDLKRSDNLNRHLSLCHTDREEYVGYKACTDFTFLCVGADYPHLFVAEKKGSPNQYVGYCTGCFKAVPLPQYTRSLESACKHMKNHTCTGKQVRTYTKTVKSEDASGNVVLKKEMQTGSVHITEEMLVQYKKRADMRYIELETNEDCDVEVLVSIENALKDSSKLKSPAMKAALAPKEAVTVAAPVVSGDVDWTQVCKELSTHKVLKKYFPSSMAEEEERVQASVQLSLTDPDEEAEELDWFEFIAASIHKGKTVKDVTAKMRKIDDEAKDAVQRAEAKVTMLELQISQARESAARREAYIEEETRKLRAALQQCQSKLESLVEVKKD